MLAPGFELVSLAAEFVDAVLFVLLGVLVDRVSIYQMPAPIIIATTMMMGRDFFIARILRTLTDMVQD